MGKSNKPFASVLQLSQKILKEYDLCDVCLGRMFAKKLGLASNKKLGEKIHRALKIKSAKCYVCKNIFDGVSSQVAKMLDVSSDYDFATFLVGTKLKPSILDRDDHMRSRFRLRGIDGIKTNITRDLAKQFSRKAKKKVESSEPDLVFMIDFKADSCTLQTKPVFLWGRYTKSERNIPQKQKPCATCLGKGCIDCNHHGISEFDSVEGLMSKYLFEKFDALQTKITWIGGEDSTSLVLGSGRPFFVKLLNPKKRHLRLPKKITLGKITIHNLKLIGKTPSGPVQFTSKVKLYITCENKIEQNSLSKLDQLENNTIAVYEKSGRRTEKLIRNMRYKPSTENSFYLSMTAGGGLPLKRFVSGDDIFPNISDILENRCRCETFDFEAVKITH
ncbi:tRNA pseudouridine(54/55) synthase Pus10 [Candidatus Nitrosotenuis sp. DW1]|uniref:tRNA pseudouridine(54/55) synthase Pus10 n=1 Tax=Candidatus Nitrosotenuis sp. DW1 TaxID=2259672 RepID=UPI001C53E75C|nr:tRNA pseudouridine(54/55) synthase Pus10 [Candidatus Nitrosotenuis sp. DW1]